MLEMEYEEKIQFSHFFLRTSWLLLASAVQALNDNHEPKQYPHLALFSLCNQQKFDLLSCILASVLR